MTIEGEVVQVSPYHFGRPRIFTSPQELERKIQEYFSWAKENKMPYNVERMAWYIGATDRTLRNYKDQPEYWEIIEMAKQYILSNTVEKIMEGEGNVMGMMFVVKHNYKKYNPVDNDTEPQLPISISWEE